MVIEYRNTLQQEGERFMIEYMFVEDNFTPAPVPSTTPSPVGGNNGNTNVKNTKDKIWELFKSYYAYILNISFAV